MSRLERDAMIGQSSDRRGTHRNTLSMPPPCLTFNSGPLGMDCTTSLISGMRCTKRRSRPIFMVMVLDGQLPQAPSSSRRTTGPSISTTRTFPLVNQKVTDEIVS